MIATRGVSLSLAARSTPVRCLRPTVAPRRPALRMASGGDKQLDQNTPDDVWKTILNAEQYYVLRQKGTEPPGTGKYNKHKEEGIYTCAGCDQPLYTSKMKFDSGCGWPAFYDEIPGSLVRHEDNSWMGKRIEIVCSKCGGHQGHVFEGEGFPTPTNIRHCVNSISVNFKPQKVE
mmetsp:Transcript_4353/g.11812  ORF Transcript_4353/g.11812 Transcript_4353/m.11812 type:complete len:175 (-) Transcript_4353:288-812(-)